MSEHHRIAWIDNAKAIGMFLIVWGHTSGIPPAAKNLIYAFHVPLFFFLSGTLAKPKYLALDLPDFLKRNLRLLVVPYFWFWCISWAFLLLQASCTETDSGTPGQAWSEPIVGLLWGTGAWLDVNVVLWFFPALFSTMLLFWIVWRIPRRRWAVATIGAFGLVGPSLAAISDFRLPWSVEPALVAVVFYACGCALANRLQAFLAMPSALKWLGGVLLAAVVVATVRLNGLVDMNSMQLGSTGLFYIGAFAGIGAVVVFSSLLPRNAVAEGIARTTIVIFPFHLIAFRIITGIAVFGFGWDKSFKNASLSWSLWYTISAMAISYALALALRRFAPWTIGAAGRPTAAQSMAIGRQRVLSRAGVVDAPR